MFGSAAIILDTNPYLIGAQEMAQKARYVVDCKPSLIEQVVDTLFIE